jgi:hypothetical protein
MVTVAGAADMVQHSMARRSINVDKLHGISITTSQATRLYTKTSTETAENGSSPEQRGFGGDTQC